MPGGMQHETGVVPCGGRFAEIGLVPDLPFVDDVHISADNRSNPLGPGSQRFFAARDLSAEPHAAAVGIKTVAITQAHPRLYALIVHVEDNLIQPGEIVHIFSLLGLGPAALDAGLLDTQRSEVVLPVSIKGIITIHGFSADGPIGRFDLIGVARFDLTDWLPTDICGVC